MKNLGIKRRTFLSGTALFGASALLKSPKAFSTSLPKKMVGLYGPIHGVAKLNANENPYGPSPAALKAMAEASKRGAYYVRNSAKILREMIAERHELSPDHVLLSSGSSGVLTYLALALSKKGKILAPDLFWDTTAKMGVRNNKYGIKRIPNDVKLGIDLSAMELELDDEVSLVHITNPNNPTGKLIPAKDFERFCNRVSDKCVVLVDEAYNELTDSPDKTTMIPLIKAGKNIAVARTFSKIYGMAGMRIGYMIAKPELLELVGQFGLGDYGLNQAGVAGALASYNDDRFLAYSKSKVLEAREMVLSALAENGLTALNSQTNFMFVDLGILNAEKFREQMEKQNVLIRGIYRDYNNWSRVSMGRIEDVQMYVDEIPKVLDALSKTYS